MKTSAMHRILVGSMIVMLASGAVIAATKPPSKNQATLGTTQLKGASDRALFGTTYTLGKTSPLNVTVNSAEYTVDQVCIGKGPFLTTKAEKLLVLHYTLHNPNKSDYRLGWSTLEIFGVDANDQNWRFVGNVGIEGTGEQCNMSLKPGQKTKVYTIIKMPAAGALPKLVIQSRDKLVLRYQLLEKDKNGNYINPVKPLPSPIADPTDPTGATALENVPGQIGEFYPLADYDAKLESMAFSDAPIQGRAPKAGQHYLVAIVSAKNGVLAPLSYRWSTIAPQLFDQDGGEIKWNGAPLYGSRDEIVNSSVAPGQELRVRFYFAVPTSLALKSFGIKQGVDGRSIVYDASSVK